MKNLNSLLSPKSIVIVGASERLGSFGYNSAVMSKRSKIDKRVYFVNSKYESLFGEKVYPSLEALPETPECIVLAVSKNFVASYLESAGVMGVKSAVVFSSGYSEVGDDECIGLENELKNICDRYGMNLLGPNCAGFVNNIDGIYIWGLNPDFQLEDREHGIGVISQSGAISGIMLSIGYMNISYAISAGNGNIITLEDMMEFLIEDEHTKVLAIYMEGVKNAKRFTECLQKAAFKRKPVVILKGGRSEKGIRSAASHTGNMAGSRTVFESVARRYGVILVDSQDQLINTAQSLSVLDGRFPTGGRFASFAYSGADATLSADLAEETGVVLSDLDSQTVALIEHELPTFAVAKNPLDGTTDLGKDIRNSINIFKAFDYAENIDGVIYHVDSINDKPNFSTRQVLDAVRIAREEGCKKPYLMVPTYECTRDQAVRSALEKNNFSLLPPGRAGYEVVANLSRFFQYRQSKANLPVACTEKPGENGNKVVLSEADSKEKIESYGIAVPAHELISDKSQLAETLSRIGYPAILKICSADIAHKTEAGGVRLNIQNLEEAEKAYDGILASCFAYCKDAQIDGILVQEMAPKGLEMILGIKSDPQFGPMILVGMGGIFVEVFGDSALAPCPINKEEAHEMITSLKAFKLLNGYRGAPACDIDALEDVMVKLSDYAVSHKDELLELDLNPVFVYPQGEGVMVVDALIVKRCK